MDEGPKIIRFPLDRINAAAGTNEQVRQLALRWKDIVGTSSVPDEEREDIENWLDEFGYETIVNAMAVAASRYLVRDQNGQASQESREEAFSRVPGICHNLAIREDDPVLGEAYKLKNFAQKAFGYALKDSEVLDLMEDGLRAGIGSRVLSNAIYDRDRYPNYADLERAIRNAISGR